MLAHLVVVELREFEHELHHLLRRKTPVGPEEQYGRLVGAVRWQQWLEFAVKYIEYINLWWRHLFGHEASVDGLQLALLSLVVDRHVKPTAAWIGPPETEPPITLLVTCPQSTSHVPAITHLLPSSWMLP